MNKALLSGALIIGITTGVLYAHHAHEARMMAEQEACIIITLGEMAHPTNHPAMFNLLKNSHAPRIVEAVEKELAKYASEDGVAGQITAEHILAQIYVESLGDPKCRGSIDEIGLMQIRPLHVKSLYSAGLLKTPDKKHLWNVETNIRCGIYILMTYAKGSKTLAESFATYNAGLRRYKAGMGYARKVMGIANILLKGEAII